MSKIDKKIKLELSQLLGTHIPLPKKNVKIVDDEGQFRIRIPKNFASLLKIDTNKDYFEFTLEKKDDAFQLKGTLKRE